MTKVQTATTLDKLPVDQPGLTEQQLGKTYAQVLHSISVSRTAGMCTDSEAQRMADAVREFYDLLTETLNTKVMQPQGKTK